VTTLVPDLLQARARETPGHVALVVDGGAGLDYGVWLQRSAAAARALADAGVRPGDRVGLLFDNPWWTDYAVCYLGVLGLGAVAVPLSPRFAAGELRRIAEHAGLELLVRPTALADLAAAADCRALDPAALERGAQGEGGAWALRPEDLAEIVYTSGTTGEPRGVACPHASIVASELPPAPAGQASFLHAFPIGTNAAQECVRMPLYRAMTAVVLPAFDAERLCAVLAERRIARLQLVPAMAQLVVEVAAVGKYDLSSVERVTLSSAPAPPGLWPQLAAAFPNAELYNAYALTEGGGARTLMRYDPDRPDAVGRPVAGTELRIVDARGEDVGPGETGEVWLARPAAPRREYHRDPAATAAAYAGRWLRTGDLGYLDADGVLRLVDRSKDIVITGGLNVSPREVEDVLHEHPAVLEAAVLGVRHPTLGEDLAAVVVPRGPADERELQRFVRSRLAEHKVPHRIAFVDALPRNASGKVLKRELRARLAEHTAATAASPAPEDAAFRAVLAAWRDVLGPDTDPREDFFALGGHSLAAAQVVARLRDALGVELPVSAVFDHPTVAELTAAIAELTTASAKHAPTGTR
jgi:acyl-CoA synthetase (AMP-forming)/AMP-acid ligase II/acyl carrier protein